MPRVKDKEYIPYRRNGDMLLSKNSQNLIHQQEPHVSVKHGIGWLIFALGASFYSYEYLLRVLPGTMTNISLS